MSVRTSSRVKIPSRRLLNQTSPEPPSSSSRSRMTTTMSPAKRRKTAHTTAIAEVEDQEDPDRLYCTCRQKDDGKTPMIQCDVCSEWYHFKCAGLNKSEAEQLSRYACSSCKDSQEGAIDSQYVFDISLLPEPAQLLGTEAPTKAKGTAKKTKTQRRTKANTTTTTVKPKLEEATSASESESSSPAEDDGSSDASGSNFGEEQESEAEEMAVDGPEDDAQPVKAEAKVAGVKRKSRKSDNKAAAAAPRFSGPADHSTPRRPANKEDSKPAFSNAHSTWSTLRRFVLGKLCASLEAVHHGYYESQSKPSSSPDAMDVDKPVGEDAAHDPTAVAALAGSTSDISQQPAASSSSAGETPGTDAVPRPSAEEIKERAGQYATEVEVALFDKHNQVDKAKGTLEPSPSYRTQFNLINSSLENDLRRDLCEGIVTQRISPVELAGMNAKDLATEETLREIRQIEAESLKSLVRVEADAPVKYTKQVLEDAEAIQKIHKAIDRNETGATTKKVEDKNDVAPQQQSPTQKAVGVDESAVDVRSPDQGPDANGDTPDVTAARPELQQEQRKSSFSLKAVLGPEAERNLDRPMSEHDDDDEEALDVASADNESIGASLDDEFLPPKPDEGRKEKIEPEVTEDQLLRLPIVWMGEVSAPRVANSCFETDAPFSQIENPADQTNEPPALVARQIGGPDLGTSPEAWKLMIPRNPISLTGRVSTQASIEYLAASRLSSSKDLVLMALTPGEGEDAKARFDALMEFHRQRDRHGVSLPYGSKPPPGGPKEVYFVPLAPGQSFDFIDLMDRLVLPSNRKEDILLAVFIVPKVKPTNAGTAKPATQAPPPPPPPHAAAMPNLPPSAMPYPVAPPAPPGVQPPPVQLANLQSLLAGLNQAGLFPQQVPGGPAPQMPPQPPVPAYGYNPALAVQPYPMPNFPPSNPSFGYQPTMPPFPPTRQPDGQTPTSAGHRPQPPVHPSRLAAMGRGGGPDPQRQGGPPRGGYQGRRGR